MDINTKMLIIRIVLSLASRLFVAAAVSTDTKITHIKYDRIITVIATVLGVTGLGIYFIVKRFLPQEVKYVCLKCGKRAPEKKDKCKKCGSTHFVSYKIENRSEMTRKIITCTVIAIMFLAVSYWVSNYSHLAEEIENQYSDFDETYDNADYVENGDTHI